MKGKCYLVGAGPGDMGLVTLRARHVIEQADVIIYDYLTNPGLLTWAKPDAMLIYVGKADDPTTIPQNEINMLTARHVRVGRQVVRLKRGDPFIFGRGGEECQELMHMGCEYEVIPGITSAVAASAYAGIPLTHRSYASSVTFLTGDGDPLQGENETNWGALVRAGGTLVIYIGMEQLDCVVERLDEMMERLIAEGMPAERLAAAIQWGTTSHHRSVSGTISNIADLVRQQKIKTPAIVLVGEVVCLREELQWFESRPLLGQTVVLTRALTQGSQFKELLREQGAEVLEVPMIQTQPAEINPLGKDFDIKNFDWLVFTSCNAVDHFFKFYLEFHDIRTLACKIAVVGPATMARLEERGLKADLVPSVYTAKGLVEAWQETNSKVLFACGNLAKDEIEKGLTSKGATVKRLEIYQTLPVTENRIAMQLVDRKIDWIIFASSSAVENFHDLGLIYSREGCRYASLGPVTSSAMKELGYRVDLQAEESRIESLVEGLVQFVGKNSYR